MVNNKDSEDATKMLFRKLWIFIQICDAWYEIQSTIEECPAQIRHLHPSWEVFEHLRPKQFRAKYCGAVGAHWSDKVERRWSFHIARESGGIRNWKQLYFSQTNLTFNFPQSKTAKMNGQGLRESQTSISNLVHSEVKLLIMKCFDSRECQLRSSICNFVREAAIRLRESNV